MGGWYLSDDFKTPKKYRIPDGTTLAAGGFLVFDESQFNAGGAGFALSSGGDEVYPVLRRCGGQSDGLRSRFSLRGGGRRRLVRPVEDQRRPGAFRGPGGPDPGGANAGPRIGPVVITEVHYHPVVTAIPTLPPLVFENPDLAVPRRGRMTSNSLKWRTSPPPMWPCSTRSRRPTPGSSRAESITSFRPTSRWRPGRWRWWCPSPRRIPPCWRRSRRATGSRPTWRCSARTLAN